MSEAENTCTLCGVKWKDITAPCPKSLTGSGVHTFYGDFRGFSSVAGSTGTEVKRGLTPEEIIVACRNIGHDMACASRAEQFYTGSSMHPHTCSEFSVDQQPGEPTPPVPSKFFSTTEPVFKNGEDLTAEADNQTVSRLEWDRLIKRWKAQDLTEELYLRRCSEVSTHQMLDSFGVPHGELSLNGRLAWLERRLCAPDVKIRTEDASVPDDSLSALTGALPAGEWTIASSGVSIDCGAIRLRCEGGSRNEKKTLMLFLKAAHAALASSEGSKQGEDNAVLR